MSSLCDRRSGPCCARVRANHTPKPRISNRIIGTPPDEPRCERGFSLVEVVISLVLTGALVATLMYGLQTMIRTSASHRQHATGAAVLMRGLENVKLQPWVPCSSVTADTYATTTLTDLPTGWTLEIASIETGSGAVWNACPGVDAPLERVSLVAIAPDGGTRLRADVVKRTP